MPQSIVVLYLSAIDRAMTIIYKLSQFKNTVIAICEFISGKPTTIHTAITFSISVPY